MDGKGIKKWPDNKIYDGEWKNDKAHGFGQYISANKAIFEGYW